MIATFPELLEMCGQQVMGVLHISRDYGNVSLIWFTLHAHFQHLSSHGLSYLHISRHAGNVQLTWFPPSTHFHHHRKYASYINPLTHIFPDPLQMYLPHIHLLNIIISISILYRFYSILFINVVYIYCLP